MEFVYPALTGVFLMAWLSTLFFFMFRKKKSEKHLSVEAQDLLADLFSSGAVLRIEILDPKNLLYYRNK